MALRRWNTKSNNIEPFHGHVPTPKSRAYFAWEEGQMDLGQLNQREAGKGYPGTLAGKQDPKFPADVVCALPPPDGKIASANQGNCEFLDEPGDHWQQHEVKSGQLLDFVWEYTARHSTRRWVYFITTKDWNPDKPLSRAQFEPEPFHTVENQQNPYWEHREAMLPPMPNIHPVPLPARIGYHVVLAIWEVAETGNAFYQVVDFNFSTEDGGERPDKPTGLKRGEVSDTQVELMWDEPASSYPIAHYIVTRDGEAIANVCVPLLGFTDASVEPDSVYSYSIKAVDDQGNVSEPSLPLVVLTLPVGVRPHAPTGLHSMGQTTNSIELMWTQSPGPGQIANYALYRDAKPARSVTGDQTSLVDSDLKPDTEYSYYLIAIDALGYRSKPSKSVSVKTKNEGIRYPAWKLNGVYEKDDKVSHDGADWACSQPHTAHDPSWAPGVGDNVLWRRL